MTPRLLALLLLATPASADIRSACAEAPSFDEALAELRMDGWEAQDRDSAFSVDQTDALAWTLVIPDLTGDSGGESPEALLDLQRASVPGLLLRRDTDTTKSRVLLQGDHALTIVQTRLLPGRVQRACRVAMADAVEGLEVIETDGAPRLAQIIAVLPEVDR